MKIIIDPYRGGSDTGIEINGQYEKNILLKLSEYMSSKLKELGIDSELVRNNDVSLTDDERISIINEIKSNSDIIIQNRLSEDNEFDIIYPLRNNDNLASQIANNLQSIGINIDKYYQRRLPTNTTLDYYSTIRNTSPNETIIIEYRDISNYEEIIDSIAKTINDYIQKKNIYIIKSGDTLYSIAKKFNTTPDEIKQINNLTNNSLNIGQKLKIPESKKETITNPTEQSNTYIVKKGDSLYQIANKYNTTVDTLKKINNLTSTILSIGQVLNLPNKQPESSETYLIYTVQKGDSLYQIAKKYNTTPDILKQLNNLKNTLLNIGQQIKVPTDKETYILYDVVKGDSLYQIAKKYNTTVNDIKSLNNLTSNTLNIGQKLKIPR